MESRFPSQGAVLALARPEVHSMSGTAFSVVLSRSPAASSCLRTEDVLVGKGLDQEVPLKVLTCMTDAHLISVDSEILVMETNRAFAFDFPAIENARWSISGVFLPKECSGNTACNEQQAQLHKLAGQGAKDENFSHALGLSANVHAIPSSKVTYLIRYHFSQRMAPRICARASRR